MKALAGILSFALGAIFGSFANVLIYRIPRRESIVFPGSHCPVCGHPLSWKDNIPIVSYLILRGRCRYCGAPISPRYPIVEALMGVLFTLGFLIAGITFQVIFVWTAFFLLTVISWIDVETGLVPDELTAAGVIIGLIGHAFLGYVQLSVSLWGLATGLVVGFFVRISGGLIFKKEAFGEGDITTLAMIGALLGPDYALSALFLGSVVGLIFVIALSLMKREIGTEIRFCPFMAIGVLIYFLISWCCNIFYVI